VVWPALEDALGQQAIGGRTELELNHERRSPADSLSAGPPDRRVNSTLVLAACRSVCGTHRPPRDTSNGVAGRGVETRPRSGHLCCGLVFIQRESKYDGRCRLFHFP
jgi:hypothetical protein